MGGKALKSLETQRLNKLDYARVEQETTTLIRSVVGANPRIAVIQAYRSKLKFGDLDLLVEDINFNAEMIEEIAKQLKAQEYVTNNNVTSYDYQGFQVDVILTKPELFESSQEYYVGNDLDNLMGRIADSAGLKLGWDGLIYRVVDETEKVEDIVMTRNTMEAIAFMGYDPIRHSEGFDTIQNIYRYAAPSPYFDADLYLLENRNAKSRVKDAKRKTYMEFLQWLQAPDGLAAHHQEASKSNGSGERRKMGTAAWLTELRAAFPACRESLDRAWAERAKLAVFKTHFNGENVAALTGLKQQALGEFIDSFRARVADQSGMTFRGWALAQTKESISTAPQEHVDLAARPAPRTAP